MYSREECIDGLQLATAKLGHSPTTSEYQSLDVSPSVNTLARRFGSFNAAKEAAGVAVYDKGFKSPNPVSDVPEHVDFTQEEWEDLSAPMRWYYKNRESELERIHGHKRRLAEHIQSLRSDAECSSCSESHDACLDFHHVDPAEKEYHISKMPAYGVSMQTLEEEVAKCVVLCKNCHAKQHAGVGVL